MSKTTFDPNNVKTWTYDFLVAECVRRLMSALFTGGGAAMKSEMHLCVNIIQQWTTANVKA